MTVSAVRPWRNALLRERSLPSGVVGPALLSALRRLASICLRDVIEHRSQQMGSFRHLGITMPFGMAGLCPGALPICPNRPLRRHQFSIGALVASSLGWLSAAADFGRVCSHSPLAIGRALIFRFSHQATSLPA